MLKRPADIARARNEEGFSLVEILIAFTVMGLVTGIGLFTVRTLLPTLKADSALQQVLTQLRQARARLDVIERCGHLPMVEKPETFHRLLYDFLVGV